MDSYLRGKIFAYIYRKNFFHSVRFAHRMEKILSVNGCFENLFNVSAHIRPYCAVPSFDLINM